MNTLTGKRQETMKIKLTNRFEKQYAALIRDDRLLRSLLDFPPAHPSLRIKRIQGTAAIAEDATIAAEVARRRRRRRRGY